MKNHLDIRRMKRPPTHPGEMLLEEFLRPLGMTQADAARRMRISASRLNALVRKKRRVTAQTALRLADFFHISPEFWLNGQTHWDLWHAYRVESRTKKARLKKKGWKFGSAATFLGLSRKESDRLDIEVARKRLADPNEVPVPYRRTRKELGLD
ncbi:MAG: HigA family addiction module antitoxin [Thermoanaerobaculia bacterium]